MKTLRLACLLLIIALSFAAGVQRAVQLGMASSAPIWVADAIPPALSELFFHAQPRYTELTVVSDQFHQGVSGRPASASDIDATIAAIAQRDPSQIDRSYKLLGADDKGIVDLVLLAFQIFGTRTQSVLTLYFVLLGISCALYVVAFRRSPADLVLLALFLIMFFLILPMQAFNQQLTSVLALRSLPVLSMVACLHGTLFALDPRATPLQMLLVVPQAALVIFAEHLRLTTEWQVLTIVILSVGVALARWLHAWRTASATPSVTNGASLSGRAWLQPAALACWPLVLILVGQLGLNVYRSVAFPEEYQRGDQILTRGFWHNIFSGLAFEPDMAQRYSLRVDDVSIIRATGQYLQEVGRTQDWVAMGGTHPNFNPIQWAPYDLAVRDMLINRCQTFPSECAAAAFYYKPLSLAGDIAWLYGLRDLPPDLDVFTSPDVGDDVKTQVIAASRRMDELGMRASLWSEPAALAILALALLSIRATRRQLTIACIATLALFAGSLIPMVVGYPAPHAMAEPAIAVGMLVYLGVCSLVRLIVAAVPRRVADARPARAGLGDA